MSNECKICEGTRNEPGELGCVWCDDTGKAGGLKPSPSDELAAFRAYMAANPMATYWSTWQERAKLGASPAKCDGNHGGPRCADPECWNDVDPVSAPIRLRDLDPAQRLALARGEPERPAAASMLRQYVSKASFAHGADRHAAIQLIEELQQRLTVADEQLDAQRLRADTAEALAAERLAAWEKCAEFRDAAEQSISDLSSLLREGIQTVERLSTTPKDYNEEQWVDLHAWTFNVDAALNPNPEAESHE